MIYENRVLATEGKKQKDGKSRKYDLTHTTIVDPWITWQHPKGNNVSTQDLVGRMLNPHVVNGKLISDLEIWDDRLTDEQKHYIADNPDLSIGYWFTETEKGNET